MLRYIICLCLTLSFCAPKAQIPHNPIPKSYHTDLQRILLINSGITLYVMTQGQLDKDSAYYFCTQVYGLSPILAWNDDYATGKDYPGNQLISSGAITKAVQLIPQSTGNSRLQLQAELANYYLHKPGTRKPDIDSATAFTNALCQQSIKENNIFWHIKALQLSGDIATQQNAPAKADEYYTQAVTLSRNNGNQKQLATSLMLQARNIPTGEPQKQTCLQEALRISEKEKLPYLQYQIYNDIIVDHFRSNPAPVEKEVKDFITFGTKIGFLHHQFSYNTLSYLHAIKGDVVNSSIYGEQAVQTAEALGDSAFFTIFCMRLCETYTNAGNYTKAWYWNKRALSLPLTPQTQMLWFKIFIQQIRMCVAQQNGAGAMQVVRNIEQHYPPVSTFDIMSLRFLKGLSYEMIDSLKQAQETYRQFLQMTAHYPPQFMYSETLGAYCFIARMFVKNKQYNEARYYALKVLNDPVSRVSVTDKAKAECILFWVDSATGKPNEAIRHLQTYHSLTDSLYSITQKKQMAELAIKYETQKKDQNIQILTQKSQLQNEQLSRSALLSRYTFAGIALLLVIITLLYNQYRLKQKAGKEAQHRNELLQKVVAEKEWLLKEIHHRVKNNLQTVVSLLESQSSYLHSKEAQIALQDSQNRIYAMSLIHQLLYHDENVASINMATYLPELVQYLNDSFGNARQICFRLTADPFGLDVSQAVPLGLILNEAITNSIKYAFTGTAAANTITIRLRQTENGKVQMQVADNGKGLPPGFDPENSPGLGIQLMKGLTEDLGGQFTIQSADNQGVSIQITFTANQLLSGSYTSAKPENTAA